MIRIVTWGTLDLGCLKTSLKGKQLGFERTKYRSDDDGSGVVFYKFLFEVKGKEGSPLLP